MYGLDIVREILVPELKARHIWIESFSNPAEWDLGAGAVNAPAQIHIDADADFLITYSTLSAFSTPGTAIATPDYKLAMMDTGSGRNFQTQPVHVRNITGSAERPYCWPEPKLVPAASTINLALTNLTTQASKVQLNLGGVKIFYFSGFSRSQLGLLPYGGG